MGLTEFGKALRICRVNAQTTLAEMAEDLKVSPAFLSAVETGRKKVPAGMAQKAAHFFAQRGQDPTYDFEALADASNEQVNVAGLSLEQQMLVSSLARSNLDSNQIARLAHLLKKMGGHE
ncbi:XRE family transcriptional regulator [Comamonadaceae bacterium OH3737_COT-264]|nr:XRE family transcriptional regulator [Comamonadaceae bacterium OH3737_COT-264]